MAVSLSLPRSVRLAVWSNAWVRGAVSLDDVVDRIRGADERHLVTVGAAAPEALILRLAELWRSGHGVALLPLPGFLDGLAGPPSFNTEAVDAGECVIAGSWGLVPVDDEGVVTWHASEVNPSRHSETVGEATTHFRRTLQETASLLARHDLDAVGEQVRAALVDVDRQDHVDLPPDLGPELERTVVSALHCLALTPAALDDHGVDLSSTAGALRRDALRPLAHAARRVLAAASATGPRR